MQASEIKIGQVVKTAVGKASRVCAIDSVKGIQIEFESANPDPKHPWATEWVSAQQLKEVV